MLTFYTGQIVTVPVTSSMTTSTGAAGGGRGTSTELVTATSKYSFVGGSRTSSNSLIFLFTDTVATTTGAGATDMTGGAAMHTAAPLMGAAGIAALLLL